MIRNGHSLSPGRRGSEGLGLNTVKLAHPHFECYFTEVIPLITIDNFGDSPHVSIVQANLSGPRSESLQSFQLTPLFRPSVTTYPPFVLLKIK